MQTESIQFNLNSKFADKYVNGSTSYCEFNLPNITLPMQSHIHIAVRNAIIPYSFYNINAGNNNMSYIENNVLHTLLISPGNYNTIQLAQYFTTNMTRFTCTYNNINNTFTFTNSVYEFDISYLSSCLTMLGMKDLLISTNKSITSTYCANMQTVQSLHIESNFMTGNFNSNNKYTQNTLCTIPINTQPYSNIVYDDTTNFKVNLFQNVLNQIVIKIVDQDDNIIDLNGLHFSITLQLDVIDFVN